MMAKNKNKTTFEAMQGLGGLVFFLGLLGAMRRR